MKKLSGRGQKFVPIDSRSDAALTAQRFRSDNLGKTPDIDVAGASNFTRQSENKFDRRPRDKFRIAQKIKTAEADVPRSTLLFAAARLTGANR